MKKLLSLCSLLGLSATMSAQVVSGASTLRAHAKPDVTIPFRYLDEGVETPIEWGLDLAWLSEENIRRGVNFAGKELIDIVRTSYMATESVEEGSLSSAQTAKIRQRSNIIKKHLKTGVGLNINCDHPSIAEWYNEASAGTAGRGARWAKVIDLTVKKYAEQGLTNLVSISPFNEPDFGWGQGYSDATRKADFRAIAKALKEDYDGAYDGVRICGGNTLNDDTAYEWWNYLKAYLDEGNTHQLAGSFANYANFFQRVRDYGHHATADELHNTMEAMVGVEYGMQTGIWWGTCEHSRSQFMKATYHTNPGRRLAYGEHRTNWTAASVYRQVDGRVQAFGGTSERQAARTTYGFVSLDRPVWYNGECGRHYLMTLPGGAVGSYQNGQSNAETVVDVQSGPDIMPHIDGTYKVVNVNSGLLMGLGSAPGTNWTSVTQRRNGTQKFLQWKVTPVPATVGDDFSYYSFTLNTDKNLLLDILNWNLDAGADVGSFPGSMGTNEQWYLEYAGEGAFYIRSRFSALCLEVRSSSKTVAANVQMGKFTGGKNQQWRFVSTDVTPDLEAPEAPTELTATAQGSSVRLDWTDSTSDDVASYTILRSEDGADYYAIAAGLKGTSFTDNEAQDGIQHYYQIYAVDHSYNYSERTSAVTATVTGERGLVMHLPFDYTPNDTTLNGNHCAFGGNVTWVDGKQQAAVMLNGTDNFIQLPYTVASHEALTVACWVYWRGGDTWQRVWDFGTGETQYMLLTPKCGSGMRFAIKDEGNEQQLNYNKNLAVNQWVHLAVTLGDEGATLYLNGEAVATNAAVTVRPSDFRPVSNYIGRSQFAADPMFRGRIDDFRIYNYALSAEEVKAMVDTANGIDDRVADVPSESGSYDLSGRPVRENRRGIVVRDGKKVLK
ncbi:MAG: RICIN domain-containing protein [Bacteroidaceae bacterium]|nr:RICIN domain-containing protein [Bacteroidaceae bacterium]